MAVHLIFLDQLGSMCAERARVEEFPSVAAPSRRQTPPADEPAKVLLNVVYGLAALKSEIADLRRQLGGGAAAAGTADAPVSDQPPPPGEKSDVLEQVFRQNMSLKDMD